MAKAFGLDAVPNFLPRYNIAPSQPVGVIVRGQNATKPEFRWMGWGLIPSWAKEPSFRAAFKYRRCLIPADGFYEWKKTQSGAKLPFYFSMAGNAVFAFAGLWESWNDIETCTILTTAANSLLQPIHDRMPVILSPEDYGRWLDPNIQGGQSLSDLLRPYPDAPMQVIPVSTRVNSAKIDDVLCIEMLSAD